MIKRVNSFSKPSLDEKTCHVKQGEFDNEGTFTKDPETGDVEVDFDEQVDGVKVDWTKPVELTLDDGNDSQYYGKFSKDGTFVNCLPR